MDIILLDLAMPVMDGMEFLKRKQQDAVLAGIPVIIITADDTTGHLSLIHIEMCIRDRAAILCSTRF